MELHRPLALARVQEAHVGVGDEIGDRRAGPVEVAGDPLDLVVAAPGLAVVVEDAEPVRLVAEVVRVPVPVLDHPRATGHERPRRLAPLAVIGGEVRVRLADRRRVRLGHEERLVAGGARLIGLEVDHPRAGLPRPARGAERGLRRGRRHRERALHRVVGVDRRDVELAVEVGGIERRPRKRHARRDELIRSRDLPHERSLLGDELRRQLRLEAAPREVVGRHGVAVRHPQVVPAAEPVRPVDEAPAVAERPGVAVALAQPVDERLERAAVVEQLHSRLVVDLVADDRRVVDIAADDLAHEPVGVEAEGRVGVVRVLAVPVGDPLPRPTFGTHLRVLAYQPRRHRVGRRAEDDVDAAPVRAVEHRLQPVEVEAPVLGLPRGPHRLADADDVEARLGHQVEVAVEAVVRLVLRVVGHPVEHLGGEPRQAGTRP